MKQPKLKPCKACAGTGREPRSSDGALYLAAVCKVCKGRRVLVRG